MLGSCVAYSLAGSAYFASPSGLSIYLCGRALGGFFSGNMSLCVGMVIRTCQDDLALLKMRTTMLRASNQATGIALAPLGGAIAVYGLYLPDTSAAIALVSAVLVAALLIDDRDTDDGDGKAMGKRGGEHGGHGGRGGRGGRGGHGGSGEVQQVSPWRDGLILLCALNKLATAFTKSLLNLSLPLLLKEPSFGLSLGLASEEALRGRISQTLGFLDTAPGIMSLLVQTAGYLWLSQRFSDGALAAWSQGAVVLGFLGVSFSTQVWHLFVCNGLMGLGMGLFMASFSNLPQEYVMRRHGASTSQALGVMRMGMHVGMLIGPPTFGYILNVDESSNRWLLRAAVVIAVIKGASVPFLAAAVQRQTAAAVVGECAEPAAVAVTAEIQKTVRAAEFKRAIGARVATLLDEGGYRLDEGRLQDAITRLIEASFPPLRRWDDATGGREHLEDLALLLRHHEDFEAVRALEAAFGMDLGIERQRRHTRAILMELEEDEAAPTTPLDVVPQHREGRRRRPSTRER